jgi:hypothetical protein
LSLGGWEGGWQEEEEEEEEEDWLVGLVIALCPQTTKHIRGGWSHYTDTSEPADGGVL